MKKIGDFLFVEQCFTDTEETKTGDIVVIETDNARIICKDPDNFFTEFENLISEEEEWQSIK